VAVIITRWVPVGAESELLPGECSDTSRHTESMEDFSRWVVCPLWRWEEVRALEVTYVVGHHPG